MIQFFGSSTFKDMFGAREILHRNKFTSAGRETGRNELPDIRSKFLSVK